MSNKSKRHILGNLFSSTAEYVLAHAKWQRSRGRGPSLSYYDTKDPRKALEVARKDVAEKREDRARSLKHLILAGLTAQEGERLVAYEYDRGPVTLKEQIDRYSLIVKRDRPQRLEAMLRDFAQIDLSDESRETALLAIDILYKYISGGLIHLPSGATVHKSKGEVVARPASVKDVAQEDEAWMAAARRASAWLGRVCAVTLKHD